MNDNGGTPSALSIPPGTGPTASGSGSRPMTTRQAVLASVVDSTHVSLTETSRKKKPLNDAELALRREETARKRKHLSEKKLEDEKAETINRLLKKQSRSKTKRSALSTAEDRTPAGASTPALGDADDDAPHPLGTPALAAAATASSLLNGAGTEGAAAGANVHAAAEARPTMYRWLSTTRGAAPGEKTMALAFCVPACALPGGVAGTGTGTGTGAADGMDVDAPALAPVAAHPAAVCAVAGCGRGRKYRLVRDWTRGACGMEHLRALTTPSAA
ncbi:hypothetical protein HETIRDRAFT_437260 [Heterobasidion irregulare TC 32-1]|uniref:INO80 complex subunit B-like conserved region domain-containing protein n=1 Tax=Heterobasidion irregulare (strain TC 32-1) TaxID=747525 RepID=W4JP50_HETIT|nr:uncharacterized protein HETIRDRAFT_437260 [Heterobasidion irregulare TC 32-1]ETW74666.1 hypothetical protein HETIRDRAFT_437260 [Heterobasidion irregulare TC 32-1]